MRGKASVPHFCRLSENVWNDTTSCSNVLKENSILLYSTFNDFDKWCLPDPHGDAWVVGWNCWLGGMGRATDASSWLKSFELRGFSWAQLNLNANSSDPDVELPNDSDSLISTSLKVNDFRIWKQWNVIKFSDIYPDRINTKQVFLETIIMKPFRDHRTKR